MRRSTLYFNGQILSMDAQDSMPEAVLTEGETIVAVGAEADLRATMPADTTLVDLQGQTMIPAFIDPHGHFPDSGFIELFRVNLSSPPLGTCHDMETALRRLRDRAKTTPKGDWVMGVAFDNTAISEGRMPTRAELDSVSRDHPVWVIHASGHNGTANSMALERQGISEDCPDPLGGRFDRDPVTGALTGLIEGISAMGALGDTTFLIDEVQFWQGFAASRDEYLSHGVTYGQNAWANADLLSRFAGFPADADPGFDLTILPIAELEPNLSQGPKAMREFANPHFTMGPRKLFSDGAFQLQTAYLREDYYRPVTPEAPRGVPYADADHLTAEVRKLHDMGFQIHCHCNGDAGADLFLDAVEAAQMANPRHDHRHTIIHGQLLHEDQFERMVQLGVTVSFFSAHIYYWGDRHRSTFLGPDRAARLSAAASAARHGIRFTLHNDASVTPTRPIHLAHCAVNRLTATGGTLGEEQQISVLSALRAQTIDAAWQVFQEGRRGSIEVGKLADLTILSRNPLSDPDRLLDTKVTKTIRRGTPVFEKAAASDIR
ncbi:amidohydrolase [Phaeobacter piscinae]|nr:amidohydrolase [Phaeobacter piscinae]